jgi:hypothetical protein
MSQSHTDTQTEPTADRGTSSPVLETQPTLRPTIASLAGVIGAGVLLIGYLFLNPTLLGTTARTEIAVNLVLLLTVIGAARLLVRLYVLTRTRYVVTPDAIRREYSLLYKTFSRELPLTKVRSHELRRSRVETVFGIGTVAFLSGSMAQSPAHLEFENVSNPERVRERVRGLLPRDTR